VSITVHPVESGSAAFGFTYVTDASDGIRAAYVNTRQGEDSAPWGHAEATNRANTVASMTGHFVVQSDERPVVMVTGSGNTCEKCGLPIPPTGKRGRPRKVHVECVDRTD